MMCIESDELCRFGELEAQTALFEIVRTELPALKSPMCHHLMLMRA